MGYPPLVHQSIGLLSLIGGLFGMFTVAIIGIVLFITGVYRYTLMMTGNRNVAGYASFAVYSSSFVETLIFGQLPSIIEFRY
jgi:4-amino-4-deoxy-L-arabinose transferase-like glycosyltransferase